MMALSPVAEEHYPVHFIESVSVGLSTPARSLNSTNFSAFFSAKSRFFRQGATAPSATGLLVALFASLTVAYFLFVCYRHLSRRSFLDDAWRILASNFPYGEDGDECSDPSRNGNDDHTPEDQPAAQAPAWTLPPMPEGVQQVMARALHLLVEPANRCVLLSAHLLPHQKRALLYHLTMIAALELSGFGFLPPPLQPLRAWVSARYLEMNQSLLGFVPESQVHQATEILEEIYKVRLWQILRTVFEELGRIVNAIESEGGTAVSPFQIGVQDDDSSVPAEVQAEGEYSEQASTTLETSSAQSILGEHPHISPDTGLFGFMGEKDDGHQQAGQGDGANDVRAAASSDVVHTTSAESTSASTSNGEAIVGQPEGEDEDLEDADSLLKLIDTTVNWDVVSDEEEGQ
ncbi:hypothetical protein Esti_003526 [Eimeria stiedai]